MSTKATLKTELDELAKAMLELADEKQDTTSVWAEKLSQVIHNYTKQTLVEVVATTVATPQDGGINFKNTLLNNINNL